MPRTLIVLEQGGAWGHAAIATVVATLLAQEGHEVVVAAPLRDLKARLLQSVGCRLIESPPCRARAPQRSAYRWSTLATVLWDIGLGADEAAPLFEAWRAIYRAVRPDAIVFNAAPFAQLAAIGLDCQRVQLGLPYGILPPVSPLPPFRFWTTVPAPQAQAFEAMFQARLTRTLGIADDSSCLGELLDADASLITSIPELDPYGNEGRTYTGPLPSPETGVAVAWRSDSRRRALAYVRAGFTDPVAIAGALAQHHDDVIVVCPDAPDDAVAGMRRDGVRSFREFIRIDALMEGADFIVSHGGGLMAHAAVHGIAQVALPTQPEQVSSARMLARAGLGVVAPTGSPSLCAEAIRVASELPVLAERVALAGRRHAALAADPLGRLRVALNAAVGSGVCAA